MQFSVPFKYTNSSASTVVLTGTFDSWAATMVTEREDDGVFTKLVIIDGELGDEIQYKYIVDGQWVVDDTTETVYDANGNLNNRIVLSEDLGLKTLPQVGSLATLDTVEESVRTKQVKEMKKTETKKEGKVKWYKKLKKMFVQ